MKKILILLLTITTLFTPTTLISTLVWTPKIITFSQNKPRNQATSKPFVCAWPENVNLWALVSTQVITNTTIVKTFLTTISFTKTINITINWKRNFLMIKMNFWRIAFLLRGIGMGVSRLRFLGNNCIFSDGLNLYYFIETAQQVISY